MAKNCKQNKYTGKEVVVNIHRESCGDVEDPTSLEFVPWGGMTVKDLGIPQDLLDVTDDRTAGNFREQIGSYKDFTLSGEGYAVRKDGSRSQVLSVLKEYVTTKDCTAWFEIIFPGITFYAYMIINDMSLSAPSDNAVTFSFEATATPSESGVVVVEDEPEEETGPGAGEP